MTPHDQIRWDRACREQAKPADDPAAMTYEQLLEHRENLLDAVSGLQSTDNPPWAVAQPVFDGLMARLRPIQDELTRRD